MVFCEADKAFIKHYLEKGYTAYTIWKHNPEKHWDKTSVEWLIKRFKAFGTMERQKGSGHPRFPFKMVQRTISVISFNIFWKRPYRDITSKKDEWPPKSLESNPLDYYFCNKVKKKVYEDRLHAPFESEEIFKNKVGLVGMRLKLRWNSKIYEGISQQTPFSQRMQWVLHQNAFWITLSYIF